MSFFTFNGKSNEEFNLKLGQGIEYATSSNDLERVTVPGRDGELLVYNNRRKAVEQSFPLLLVKEKGLTTDVIPKITEWLSVKGFRDMSFSWDKEHIYKSAYLEGFSVEETLKQFGKTKLNFLLHPIKYRKDGFNRLNLSNNSTILGKGNVMSDPVITIRGNGEGVLTINGRQTKFKNVQGVIVFDMQKKLVYSGNLPAWDKVVRSPQYVMPKLDPGENRISWTGNFSVELIPYWGVMI